MIKPWIEKKLLEILGFEDEFLINYVISLLENKVEEIDPKKIQILLTGINSLFSYSYLLIFK